MADVTSTFAARDVGFNATVTRMQRTLMGFQSSLNGFGMRLAGLGATFLGVQATMSAFREGLGMAGKLSDLSAATGESAGQLRVLERAFENNGVAADKVGPLIGKMARFITDFREGSALATQAADDLGISVEDLSGKTPIEQFKILSRALNQIPDPMKRTSLAMDLFGKSGREVLPLASNLSAEIATARLELGSLVPILDENAVALDALDDKLNNAIGGKLTELAVGLAAGVTGANDFATALSRIDAAGLGKNIGDALRIAFDAPMASIQALGSALLTGIAGAGNTLINMFATAGSFFFNLLTDGEYWSGVGQRLTSAFMEAINSFNKLLLYGIENILLKPLANLPSVIGDPFRAALETTGQIRDQLEAGSQKNYENFKAGGDAIKAATERALANTSLVTKDWLGVEGHAKNAAHYLEVAKKESAAIREEAASVEQSFVNGSAALTNALKEIRGFDLTGKETEKKPDWTKSNQPAPSGGGGGGGGRGGGGRGGGGSSERLLTRNERIAEMKGRARSRAADERADRLEARGFFNSADSARERAKEQRNEAMTRGRLKDLYETGYGGARNLGEAYDKYKRETPLGKRLTEKQFDEMNRGLVKDQTKSAKDRAAEEQALRDQHGTKGGAGKDPAQEIYDLLNKHIPKIDEKLPQTALVYS